MEEIIYKISDICKLYSGGDAPSLFSKTRDAFFQYPIFSNGIVNEGLYGYSDRAEMPANSITISARGTVGVVFYRKERFLPIVRLITLVPNAEKVNSRYLFYLLKCLKIDGFGTSQQQITIPYLRKKNIKIIKDISNQQKIADILSTYDELIENNNKRIKILEQMAENLYKEWFVRFRFPNHETTEFENGLPKGWKVKKLFDVAKVDYGFAFKSDLFCNDSSLNSVVRIRDIADNKTDTYTSEECLAKYLIEENAILVGMDGIFHMCLWNGEKAYLNQRVVKINSKYDGLSNYHLYFMIYPQVKFWEQTISGTTVAHLGDKHLRKMTIIIPEKKTLKKANVLFSNIMVERNRLLKKNQNLTKQRDLLLPRLMSGKLEVQ